MNFDGCDNVLPLLLGRVDLQKLVCYTENAMWPASGGFVPVWPHGNIRQGSPLLAILAILRIYICVGSQPWIIQDRSPIIQKARSRLRLQSM